MKARPASSADLDEILAIQARWPGLPAWSGGQFFSPGSLVSVAEEEGRVAAYCVFLLVPPEAQLLMIAVDPDRARSGIGRLLLGTVVEELKGRGFESVTLEVGAANRPALSFYKKFGFVEVGRRGKYYPDGTDAILMDLILRKVK